MPTLTKRMTGVDLVLTSPLVRAVQTAQILALTQKHEGLLHAHRSLIPDMPVGALDSVLREHASQNLVLVGHQPSMGAMAARLLGIASFPKPVLPGTVIGIQGLDEGTSVPGTLLFYAAPGQPVADSL
jgi:phosphohistidine phosphatase